MAVIVVVGPDKAGKTTLVNYLRKDRDFRFMYYKGMPSPTTAEAVQLVDSLLTFWSQDRDHWVCDRLPFPDEMVYRPVVEGIEPVEMKLAQPELERRFNELGSLLIYVTASLETLRNRYEALGGDDFLPFDKVPRILEAYQQFFSTTTVRHIEIDTDIADEESAYCIAKEAFEDLLEDLALRAL